MGSCGVPLQHSGADAVASRFAVSSSRSPTFMAGSAFITREAGSVTITSVPSRGAERSWKPPPCNSIQPLDDGQAEAGSLLRRLQGPGAAPPRRTNMMIRDLVFGIPGPLSRMDTYCPPEEVQPPLITISPPGGGELHRIREDVEDDPWRRARSSRPRPAANSDRSPPLIVWSLAPGGSAGSSCGGESSIM